MERPAPPPVFVAALDQGTTSTRCLLLDAGGHVVASESRALPLSFPQAGWVEQDAALIARHAREVIDGALARVGAGPERIAALGITNQRETVVL